MTGRGREVQLVEYPHGGVETSHFRIVEVDVPTPAEGQVLVRNTFTSVDPGMRLRLRESGPAGYFNSFPLQAAMDGIMTVGEVVESRADGFAPGDSVWHASGWREYSIVAVGVPALSGLGTLARIDTDFAPPEKYLGPLGGMGLTAYLLDDLGLDVAFNYRDGSIVEQLREAAPDGIDVYFDNVAGDHLEAALATLRRWGRVAMCGALSEYQTTEPQPGPRNLFQAVSNDLTLRGFRGSSYLHRFPDVRREIGGWLADGRLVYRETIFDGLERAPEAIVEMLSGNTTGKAIVRI
jgi:NADPH-dependent curcumin reductase CurA